MTYRISFRARKDVAEWEEQMEQPFDTSGKGKSALIAAAYRGLHAEIYNYTEEQVIGVFHDFEKFFDTIDLAILLEKAVEAQFPIIDLLITMLQHMAPRIIQCDSFCIRTIINNTSILAGCKHSMALTRVLFLTGVHKLCIDNPLAAPKIYVDDTAMLTAGDQDTALLTMSKAVKDFLAMAKLLGLTLGKKGVVVAKKTYAARLLVQEIKDMGTTYNVAESTRDLEVDFSFSKNQKVRKSILKTRIKNSQGALNKIYIKLAKISRRARVLFSGAGFSKATWGHQTSGLSYQEWSKIEVAAVNAAGFGKGRCRYTALCVAYGPEGHPFGRGIKELFILWFKLILPMTRHRDPTLYKIEEAWSQIYIKMSEGQQSITLENCMSETDGIAAQVVVILYSLGWIPVSYDKWLDPEGNEWILAGDSGEPFPVMPLIWKILHTYHRKQIDKNKLAL